MNVKDRQLSDDGKSAEHGKDLSDEKLKDLDLAGGVEGGMPAGSAGGPSQSDVEKRLPSDASKRRPRR